LELKQILIFQKFCGTQYYPYEAEREVGGRAAGESERNRKWRGKHCDTLHFMGVGEEMIPAWKVPRQCPFALLVEIFSDRVKRWEVAFVMSREKLSRGSGLERL
jgi:hypothetical protein